MKLPNSHADSHASADVTDSQLGAPTFRNPFVYELKLTATEKIKVSDDCFDLLFPCNIACQQLFLT